MKKKLKDLTEDEIQRVCDSHKRCYGCPLKIGETYNCLVDYIECEIDVPEEELL